jgi:hypothetical protein
MNESARSVLYMVFTLIWHAISCKIIHINPISRPSG